MGKYSILIFAFFLLFCISSSFAQSPENIGKYTRKYRKPVCAQALNSLAGEKVKQIRGTLSIGDEVPKGSIISLYLLNKNKFKFITSFLVGANGKFNFAGLKEGTYLLRTGTIDGGFNCTDVEVLLAPKDKDSLDKDLEIWLEVGT